MELDQARSVARKPLPPVPEGLPAQSATLVLFYQYVEPSWTPVEHRKALAQIISIAKKNDVTGRGRCAPEGLNCTLSGTPEGVRAFCMGLRAWNPIFEETDFKLTDGIEYVKETQMFIMS